MSEDQPRSEAGQFASAEPLTGIDSVEEAQGFTRMPEAVEDRPEPTSDIMSEVKNLQAKREQSDTDIVDLAYRRPDGEPSPPNLTVPLDKAVSDISEYHKLETEGARRVDDLTLAKHVDSLRAEALADNPDIARELGLSAEEVAAAKAAEAEAKGEEPTAAIKAEQTAEPAADDPYSDIEGLEPETREALKKPQIRQAIENEINKAAQTQQAYTVALQQGQQVARATIAALAPQLDGIALEHWPAAIQAIAQADPVRGKLVADTLSNWSQIQERQQLVDHHQQQVSRQNFESYVKSEDARVEQLAKAEGIAVDNAKIVSYWESQGVSRNQFVQFCINNPAAASAEGRLMVLKAQRYDEMMKAPKPKATRDLPPVTRPASSAMHARGDSSSTKIASLQKQLETATGHKAARIGAQLLAARRNANS
jgi:hypothetical protein